MNRPSRQRAHLLEKITRKESRTPGKVGKRTKAWRKWAEAYKAVAEGTAPATPVTLAAETAAG
jgi:hypothetical protein